MSPPLSREDLEAIAKIVDRRVEERLRPVEHRANKLSGKLGAVREEVSPAVARKISDSQHELEDRSIGFERLVLESLESTRQEQADLREIVAKSLPPAAKAATGAEAAAVAGANAALATQGATKAVQVAADRADTQSLAAKVKAKQTLIVQVLTVIALTAWQIYEHIARLP